MSWIEVDQYGRPKSVNRTVTNTGADHGHCVACGHALTLHGRATGTSLSGCVLCACDAAVEDRNAANAQGKPVTFEDLIERIQALTGLSPRRASVVAGEVIEVIEVGVHPEPSWPDHLIAAKAKELGYLSDSWRLP